jgi:hypothetical protein
MHYRCAVILGVGEPITGTAKRAALDVLSDHLLPGRREEARPPSRRELAATAVVAIPIVEWSVKVSDKPPAVVDEDDGWSPWTGVLPLRLAATAPVTAEGGAAPPYVTSWHR